MSADRILVILARCRGLSLAELARRTGTSRVHLSFCAAGRKRMSVALALRVADELGVALRVLQDAGLVGRRRSR